MLASQIPAKFNIPFGFSAGGGFIRAIPEASQIGIIDGAASLTDGFPPDCFLPVAAGGVPPFGADVNGILFESTSWDRWYSAGGPIPFDATFSTAVGGYPAGAIVASTLTLGLFFFSLVDSNTSNPDTGGANWQPLSPLGFSTGDAKITFKTTADYGWILINADPFTIGDATSGASYANALAAALYALVWGNVSNSWAPVSSGRGANAAADFAAHKTLAIPKQLGRALAIGGAGTGLTARALGQILGEETHVLSIAELPIVTPAGAVGINDPQHDHQLGSQHAANTGINFTTYQYPNTTGPEVSALSPTGITASFTGTPFGSGSAHNVMQPTTFWNIMVKL